MQRFCSQPMTVAEAFTGIEGKYVTLKETIQGFKDIMDGKLDHVREDLFFLAGNIDDVKRKYDEDQQKG